ncbi:MAG: alpha-amylase family glycosyl hydrolase [Thermoflexaceae bacterium]|nr:alpha-amylase family glycosyl hydrolase [Thermoflexaceae bacterium]
MKQSMKAFLCILILNLVLLTSCTQKTESVTEAETTAQTASGSWKEHPLEILDDKYRTYYEIFVYSFYDSDGDGIGDLQGVIEKLDYLNDGDDTTDTDLGINGIWLMPVMPSETYHKYDTTDYMGIDSQYGTLEDFKELISACHERNIRVIIDLVMNHSSSKHPWFVKACEYLKNLPEGAEPDTMECPYVEYYHFSREAKSGYSNIAGTDWYYEAQFWSEMPDLNLENEAVRKEFEQIADFWLLQGVDGFRLDAVKEYVSGNADKNVEILKWFQSYVKSVDEDAYIVCECWVNREEYAKYYESSVDSMFDFHYADKTGIIANVVNGKADASSYGRNMTDGDALYSQYNADYIDAPFYTNHDMGRSAGYYAGANSLAQTKMGNALNILMSGNVFIYYGEELGMKGSGSDENKRAPMYWSKDENQEGMCSGPENMDDFEMKFDSLMEQEQDSNSIYHYVKDAIRLRNQNPEIARGKTIFYEEESGEDICVISREYNGNEILMIFNISPESAETSLDNIVINGKHAGELDILGELLTGGENVLYNGNKITMPGYSVVVLGIDN